MTGATIQDLLPDGVTYLHGGLVPPPRVQVVVRLAAVVWEAALFL